MSTLRVRFAAMLATAAVVPLLTYGVVSVYSLREGTRRTVTDGNLNVARQVGEQIRRYIATNLQILHALAADLDNTGLNADQQDRILKNYVLRFPEFRELTAFDAAGRPIATSRIGAPTVAIPGDDAVDLYGARMSPVFVDNDMLPTALVAAPLGRAERRAGWLVGEFSIEELWRLTGRIRVGASGYAVVVGPRGDLLAHGNAEERSKVARGESLAADPVVVALRSAAPGLPEVRERRARPANRCWSWAFACRNSAGWCSSSSRRGKRSRRRAATSAASSPPSAWRSSSCCSRASSGAVRSSSPSASSSAARRQSPAGTSTNASASGRRRRSAALARRSTDGGPPR